MKKGTNDHGVNTEWRESFNQSLHLSDLIPDLIKDNSGWREWEINHMAMSLILSNGK